MAKAFDWSSYPHFCREEMKCQCGCGAIGKDPDSLSEVLRLLEKVRKLVGGKLPINITSGYRCPSHNIRKPDLKSKWGVPGAGGVRGSYHTKNKAVDFWVPGLKPEQLALIAKKAGFLGVGIYYDRGFIHCDIGDNRMWHKGTPN